MELVVNRQFRSELLALLVRLYAESSVPDYINVTRCLGNLPSFSLRHLFLSLQSSFRPVFLNRPDEVAGVLTQRLQSSKEVRVLSHVESLPFIHCSF